MWGWEGRLRDMPPGTTKHTHTNTTATMRAHTHTRVPTFIRTHLHLQHCSLHLHLHHCTCTTAPAPAPAPLPTPAHTHTRAHTHVSPPRPCHPPDGKVDPSNTVAASMVSEYVEYSAATTVNAAKMHGGMAEVEPADPGAPWLR